MNIKNKATGAPRTRLSEFSSWFLGNENHPSSNNRWSVLFTTPKILRPGGNFSLLNRFSLDSSENRPYFNYYADNVQLPSKQVTTGSITSVGSTYNYATSSTFSQISMDFIMPRNHKTRIIFERWISIMSSDANQMTDYYDDYVCPNLLIFKWERGGGPEFKLPKFYIKFLKSLGINPDTVAKYKDDQIVGIYDIQNAFPYNLGSSTLTNAQMSIQTLNVQFYYERYRFHGLKKYDEKGTISLAAGGADADSDIAFAQLSAPSGST